jgi:hypothetical protein
MATGFANDADFWAGPFHHAPELAADLLREQGAEGAARLSLHLRAPAILAMPTRASLPVVLGLTGPAREVRAFALHERAILVAIEEASGRVLVERARAGDRRAALPPPAGFDGVSQAKGDPVGFVGGAPPAASVWRVELVNRLGLPWAPGVHRLVAIALDRASAPSIVRVEGAAATHDPAVDDYVARERERRAPAAVWPAPDPQGRAPLYLRTDRSPRLRDASEGDGVALAAPRVVVARDGATCLLDGSFRLPSRRDAIAASGAIAAITLVITATEDAAPIVVPLRVPSFDAAPQATVTGFFSVDLFGLTPMAQRPQTYFVHAIAGAGVVADAVTVAVIPEGRVS